VQDVNKLPTGMNRTPQAGERNCLLPLFSVSVIDTIYGEEAISGPKKKQDPKALLHFPGD